MKRFSMWYESDELVCGSYDHQFGMASTIKTAKQYISKCKKSLAQHNPRNFRIYDHYADVDQETDHVPCIYQED